MIPTKQVDKISAIDRDGELLGPYGKPLASCGLELFHWLWHCRDVSPHVPWPRMYCAARAARQGCAGQGLSDGREMCRIYYGSLAVPGRFERCGENGEICERLMRIKLMRIIA